VEPETQDPGEVEDARVVAVELAVEIEDDSGRLEPFARGPLERPA
jgi:hypothetical protein